MEEFCGSFPWILCRERESKRALNSCACILSHLVSIWNVSGCPRNVGRELNIDSARVQLRDLIQF